MLAYYQDIMPEGIWQDEPLPTCFWANSLKVTPETLSLLLEAEGIVHERLAWHPYAFKTSDTRALGRSWLYLTGLLQIQEEVSMLPGVLMGVQPGETVLDFCAAPGNKTAQLAVEMKNTGTLIANDRNYGRMRALGQIQKRLGLLNISTTVYDATSYPRIVDYFDRVLADVPCSCEGTFRKGRDRKLNVNVAASKNLATIQLAILKKAIKACKPAGRVIYSTCTFSPHENEWVINEVLKEGAVTLEPIHLSGFVFSPGLTTYQGLTFDHSLQRAMRVWPQQNNTGGFFVASLRKSV